MHCSVLIEHEDGRTDKVLGFDVAKLDRALSS